MVKVECWKPNDDDDVLTVIRSRCQGFTVSHEYFRLNLPCRHAVWPELRGFEPYSTYLYISLNLINYFFINLCRGTRTLKCKQLVKHIYMYNSPSVPLSLASKSSSPIFSQI